MAAIAKTSLKKWRREGLASPTSSTVSRGGSINVPARKSARRARLFDQDMELASRKPRREFSRVARREFTDLHETERE